MIRAREVRARAKEWKANRWKRETTQADHIAVTVRGVIRAREVARRAKS